MLQEGSFNRHRRSPNSPLSRFIPRTLKRALLRNYDKSTSASAVCQVALPVGFSVGRGFIPATFRRFPWITGVLARDCFS